MTNSLGVSHQEKHPDHAPGHFSLGSQRDEISKVNVSAEDAARCYARIYNRMHRLHPNEGQATLLFVGVIFDPCSSEQGTRRQE